MRHGFQGDSVIFASYAPTFDIDNVEQGLISYGTSIVGPGVEFPDIAALSRGPNAGNTTESVASVDISAHSILIQSPAGPNNITIPNYQFDGYIMEFSGNHGAFITGANIVGTNVAGLTNDAIDFKGNDIGINFANLTFEAGISPFVRINVTFGHSNSAESARHLLTGEA